MQPLASGSCDIILPTFIMSTDFFFFFYFLKFIFFFTFFFKFIFWLCSMRDLSSPTGARTHAPGSGSMSPNHWTGGEVFQLLFVF